MKELRTLVHEALSEDIGQGDITTDSTVKADARCHAWLLAKQDGVLSGIKVFRLVLDLLEADVREWEALADGSPFKAGQKIASFTGKTRAILTGERLALNFVQHFSGIATYTAQFVERVKDLPVKVCDTRKTTPLLRKQEKEAVRHGGATNHRYALFDGVLIKENHIVAAGGIRQALQAAIKDTHHLMKIGVEVTNLDEMKEAMENEADAVLLDNMDCETMRKAVEMAAGTRLVIEASGNVTLDRVREIAETGVHLISIGALTHSAPAVDLSLTIHNS
jgi:nicotinate-nucleotide pyrophosphorylase (carboxylating)